MHLLNVVYLIISLKYVCCDENYGPFRMLVTKLDICKGPKNKNCTVLTPTIVERAKLVVNIKVTENCHPSQAKIVAISNGKELMRLQMNKPCEHLFLRPLLERLFTVTTNTNNCVLLKGDYNCQLDMDQMSNSYFGGKFFYGNMTFKSILYGKDSNFSCTVLHVTIVPRN